MRATVCGNCGAMTLHGEPDPQQIAALREAMHRVDALTSRNLEDFDVQVAAARRSMETAHFASARAELRGAMLAIDAAERQSRLVTMVIDGRPLANQIREAIERIKGNSADARQRD